MTIQLAERDIRHRAYELWEARGCPEGSPAEDWHAAEQQLRVDLDAVSSPLPPLAEATAKPRSPSRLRRGTPSSPFEI